MAFFLRGALVEYGTDVEGPITNIVVFQFNPESISHTLNIAQSGSDSPESNRQTESSQTSAPPTENFSITTHFSAADDLGKGGKAAETARKYGVGPQLAALMKMAYTSAGIISGEDSVSNDPNGDTLNQKMGGNVAIRQIPREELPRIFFIWGSSRVLPVEIKSMSINEKKFDPNLNPVEAEVQISLQIAAFPKGSDDKLGKGALNNTQKERDEQVLLSREKKETQASLNQGKSVNDIIPF